MAASIENGGISLILLNCNGETLSAGDENAQRIVVDRMNLPPEMHNVPENELALIGMPEGSFAVIHWQEPEVVTTNDVLPDKLEDTKDCSLTVEWSHKMTLLLLELYRKYFDEFQDDKVRKKTVWDKIAAGIESEGYGSMTWKACAKKFYNLRSTYQGMIDNRRKRGCKKWPYYDVFYNMFGYSSSTEAAGNSRPVRKRKKLGVEEESSANENGSADDADKEEILKMESKKRLRSFQQASWLDDFMTETHKAVQAQIKMLEGGNDESSGRSHDAVADEKSPGSGVEWTHNLTLILLELYQVHADDFKNDRIRKKTVWGRIAAGIQSAGYANMTWDVCEKKFRNLKSTYRTIVENSKKTERNRTKWPYYDIFLELFGNGLQGTPVTAADSSNFEAGDCRNESGELEMECSSISATMGCNEIVDDEVIHSASVRKRKGLPPPWMGDLMIQSHKTEENKDDINDESLNKSKDLTLEFNEDENIGSGVEWTRNVTLLLLELFRCHFDEFENGKTRKKTVWGKVAAGIQAAGHENMTWDVCEKKFRNLKSTYRTIIEGHRKGVRGRTKWPYYEFFHELFGNSSSMHSIATEGRVDNLSLKPSSQTELRVESSSLSPESCSKETSKTINVQKHANLEPLSWLADFMTETHKAVEARLKQRDDGTNGSELSDNKLQEETPETKNSGSAFEWTHNMTLLLLDLYRIHITDFENGNMRKKTVWGRIASQLQAVGYGSITWDVCEKKFRNLKCTYWTIVENNRRTGRGRKKWPYYEIFQDLLGSSPVPFQSRRLESDSVTFKQKFPEQRPAWLIDLMTEMQKSEEAKMKLLEQMYEEQKQQAVVQLAALNELNVNIRQILDRLNTV